MEKRKRSYRLDDRTREILTYAQEKARSRWVLGSQIAYPEHFYLALAILEEEMLTGILKALKGVTTYSKALQSARAYLLAPLRHAHAGNEEELAAGMSKKLLETIRVAAQIASPMSDAEFIVISPELMLLAAETERVGQDVVMRRWGINMSELRMHYRRIGIDIPITHGEQEQLWTESAMDIDQELRRHVAR